MSLTQTRWRNGDPDADGETPLGRVDHIAWIAWHFRFPFCSGHDATTFRGVQPLGFSKLARNDCRMRGLARLPSICELYQAGVARTSLNSVTIRIELLSGLLRHRHAVVLGAFATVTVAAWAYLLLAAGMEMDMGGGPKMVAPSAWSPPYAALICLMWWVMMVAMILPTAAPTVLLVTTLAWDRLPNSNLVPAAAMLFASGYLLVWSGVSLAATLLQWRLENAGLLSERCSVMGFWQARFLWPPVSTNGRRLRTPASGIVAPPPSSWSVIGGQVHSARSGRGFATGSFAWAAVGC